jgi:hypothetical protein
MQIAIDENAVGILVNHDQPVDIPPIEPAEGIDDGLSTAESTNEDTDEHRDFIKVRRVCILTD